MPTASDFHVLPPSTQCGFRHPPTPEPKMLTNTQFASLLKAEPESFQKSESFQKKDRFDLSQVKAWDKQYQSALAKKKVPFKRNAKSANQQEEDENKILYRDRASERRKELKPAEVAELEAVAATLSAEQSKFLGGDIEHTHLVKGLDFALLHKTRTSEGVQREPERETSADNRKSNVENIKTTTKVGAGIVDVLWRTQKPSLTSKKHLEGLAFEFNLSIDSDIPTTVSGRNKLWSDEESTVRFELDVKVIEKLRTILHGMGEINDASKKRKKGASSSSGSISAKVVVKTDAISIYDDIGVYQPSVGHPGEVLVSTSQSKEIKVSANVSDIDSGLEPASQFSGPNSAKGLFSGIRPLSSSSASGEEERLGDGVGQQSLLDSVRGAIGAAKAKELALLARAGSALAAAGGVAGESASGKAQSRVGDFLSRQSGSDDFYNMYPDSAGAMEVMYNSDDDEEEGGGETKKKKSKPSGGGVAVVGSGMNRAARRAAAGKATR